MHRALNKARIDRSEKVRASAGSQRWGQRST
jgi:hypothetical protein